MKKLTPAAGTADGPMASDGASRREFLQAGTGAAAGAALMLGVPKVASAAVDKSGAAKAAEPKATVTKPSGPPPQEPVTAYVRNAQRGEVTVLSGTQETTYKDPALAKRLIDAAGHPQR